MLLRDQCLLSVTFALSGYAQDKWLVQLSSYPLGLHEFRACYAGLSFFALLT